jgi:hypothetical protein
MSKVRDIAPTTLCTLENKVSILTIATAPAAVAAVAHHQCVRRAVAADDDNADDDDCAAAVVVSGRMTAVVAVARLEVNAVATPPPPARRAAAAAAAARVVEERKANMMCVLYRVVLCTCLCGAARYGMTSATNTRYHVLVSKRRQIDLSLLLVVTGINTRKGVARETINLPHSRACGLSIFTPS